MQKLIDLTESGNIKEANKWFSSLDHSSSHIKKLGIKVAKSVLEREKDRGRAATILLLTALDSAYNSVLAVGIIIFRPVNH